jgi:hypothetical protein
LAAALGADRPKWREDSNAPSSRLPPPIEPPVVPPVIDPAASKAEGDATVEMTPGPSDPADRD